MQLNYIFLVFVCSLISLNLFCSNFDYIGEIKITDWPSSGMEVQDFTKPNEHHTLVYSEILKDKLGILIGVGTFRNLVTFTMGNFSYLMMLDYDQRVVDFNREHLRFIEELSRKYTKTPDQRKVYFDKYESYLLGYVENNQSYYWECDKTWERIINAIKDKRIFVGKADFFDKNKNKSIIEAINNNAELNLLPRTLDVSNVLFFPLEIHGKDFLNTLKSLSNNPDIDLVLMTNLFRLNNIPKTEAPHIAKETKDDLWFYYYSSLKEYLNYLDQSLKIPNKQSRPLKSF
jgi:hypothetical protein